MFKFINFPITAISSITNRVTGLGITGMYIGLGSSLLFNKNVFELYDKAPQPAKSIINYTVLFPNIYHTLAVFVILFGINIQNI